MLNRINQNPKYILFGIIVVVSTHLPLFLLGEDSIVRYYDNLDCDFIYLHILKSSNHLFCINPNHVIPTIFNGLKVSNIHSSFNFINIFFYFLSSFWAYAINGLVVRIIGFLGTWYLLKNHFQLTCSRDVFLLSLFYALIPLFTIYGISISGLPLIYFAFLNLKSNKHLISSYLLILFYVSYSHFFLVGPFLLTFLFLNGLVNKIKSHWYWMGIAFFIFISFLSNVLFFYEFIFGETSHRVEIKKQVIENSSFVSSFIYNLTRTFLFGVNTFSTIFIAPILLIAVGLKIKLKDYVYLFLILIVSFLFVFYEFYLPSFSFNLSRFTALTPLLLLLFLGTIFSKYKERKIQWVSAILGLQILFNLYNDPEIGQNYASIVGLKSPFLFKTLNKHLILPFNKNILKNKTPYKQIADLGIFGADRQIRERIANYEDIRFKQFYSVSAFNQLKKIIPATAKTLSIGFHPAITQYNGLATLDSYQNFYPLEYKHNFRNIIKDELDKNSEMKNQFDTWGNRVYTFSTELYSSCKFDCHKEISTQNQISTLAINTEGFMTLGGTHIISAVEILSFEENNFEFLKKIEAEDSRYNFFIYQVKR